MIQVISLAESSEITLTPGRYCYSIYEVVIHDRLDNSETPSSDVVWVCNPPDKGIKPGNGLANEDLSTGLSPSLLAEISGCEAVSQERCVKILAYYQKFCNKI